MLWKRYALYRNWNGRIYINKAAKDYPAEKAGLKVGDIIVKIDETQIQTPYDLLAQILRHNVGEVIVIKFYRDGIYKTVDLKLVETPLAKNTD